MSIYRFFDIIINMTSNNLLPEGSVAPDFSLFDQDGKSHRLSDYRGKKVILYFYPKDDTPGCTKEACEFAAAWGMIKDKAVVLGVSADSIESHKKFAQKYHLPFPLLSDPQKEVIKKYGAWGKKKFMGREFEGILRITYLIDETGKIAKVFPKVDPAEHAKEIMQYI